MEKMRIVLPGGSGQVGTLLARTLTATGHAVTVLSRQTSAPDGAAWRVAAWDAQTLGDWANEIDGADAVINLAGRSVNCRYNDANRKAIMDSRVDTTRLVGQAIAKAKSPPPTWLQMSTATIYAHCYDSPNDEATGILGGNEPDAPDTWRFSIEVAKAWEAELDRDRYAILSAGWEGKDHRVHHCLVHLDIIGGKVWIQRDNTEDGIGYELERAGIPKGDIVPAFHPPSVRPFTGYGVA